ncbi:hypothetical protein [Bacillus velezensis]|uniref:hypothetical protein n=1 Tax=Bacillus velezensis TaxID=492670 RepID=UPI0003873182|nr:hypothetical protein [Bacillus velezensis]QDF56059.1 hypothetical protein D073_1698 [Bacillus velezensis]CDG25992.1 protein of unknown function [Bacillus velezensis UCMB5113]
MLKQFVSVKDKAYSIYIGNNVSVGHDALIHGPCYLGNHTFIGFKAIVYNAIIGN